MNTKWLFITTGFALFSMFFGSGNLVFPITVGQESEGHYFLASLGIILSGVVVPFMGVLGMLLYKGDINSFFSSFGKKGVFIFSFLALALMGPFGVLARCLTVAHGALLLLLPGISLPYASLGFCAIIFLLTANKNSIVSLLGTYLTPILLLSIGAIGYFGLSKMEIPPMVSLNSLGAFNNGFFQGYQTMDLLAAFFFSQFVISQLHERVSENSDENAMLKLFCKSAMVGAVALSAVYCMLVVLGWVYHPLLTEAPPQEMLGIIAMASLGDLAAPCLCLAIVLACITTAIVLTSLFADFLRHNVCQEKIGRHLSILITLAIGFSVSTLDFGGIARFLGPLLETVYPALITLTVVNIISKAFSLKTTHWPFTLAIVAKLAI